MMALLRFWIFAHLIRLTEILLELHVNFKFFFLLMVSSRYLGFIENEILDRGIFLFFYLLMVSQQLHKEKYLDRLCLWKQKLLELKGFFGIQILALVFHLPTNQDQFVKKITIFVFLWVLIHFPFQFMEFLYHFVVYLCASLFVKFKILHDSIIIPCNYQ